MWIAGLNHGSHDASCALLRDGELVIAVEQERLSRRKHAVDESPADALRFCLDFAGVRLSEVDVVALGSDHAELARWLGLSATDRQRHLPFDQPERLFPDRIFDGERPRRIQPVAHHRAHAASAFWLSGFDECAVLVMDAMGESTATSIAAGRGSRLEIVESYGIETSLGFYYEAASEFVGLGRHDGGKLMGLAAYGRPVHDAALAYRNGTIVWEGVPAATGTGRDLIAQRSAGLQHRLSRSCFPYAPREHESIMAYADLAASVQHALEETVLGLARRARDVTGLRRLAMAGGVALNCTANGRLANSGIFDEVYVQPMAHDAGVALGAALLVAAEDAWSGPPARMSHAYWGPDLNLAEVGTAIAASGLSAEELTYSSLLARVASIIEDGGLVAWAQGRSEVGPRALGARSLLGDPRNRGTLTRLNMAKSREMWRPVAPSVPVEHFDRYFVGIPNPFMIVASQVRPEMRTIIPAVVHVDGSARPQAVSRSDNRPYHDLLTEFGRRTGVPVLVNTSLNVAKEPIADSAWDVIHTFRRSGADAVVLGRYIALRS